MWAPLACGGVDGPPAAAPVEAPTAYATMAPPEPIPEPAQPEEPRSLEALAPVEIRAIAAPRGPDRMPKVSIASPRSSDVIAPGKAASFLLKLDVDGWQTGGSHVHLVLDGAP